MTPEQATRARALAALGFSQRGIAAELGLSRRLVERALAEAAPALASPELPASFDPDLPELSDLPEPEPWTSPPVDPPPTGPAPRRTPAPTPPALAKAARDRAYEAACERARLAVEAHGYQGAPPSQAPTLRPGATLDDTRRALRNATAGRVI